MATCSDFEFEIDEVFEMGSYNSSHHNVKPSENIQNDLIRSKLGLKKALHHFFEKVLSSTQPSITDECALPSTDNSTQHIQQNMLLE